MRNCLFNNFYFITRALNRKMGICYCECMRNLFRPILMLMIFAVLFLNSDLVSARENFFSYPFSSAWPSPDPISPDMPLYQYRPPVAAKYAAPQKPPPIFTEPNLKVAFIGDQGASETTDAVLRLIRDEGAAMTILSGDFDYDDDPNGWDARITAVLGADYPLFASIGNHEVDKWGEYQNKLKRRLRRVPGAKCSGDLGVKSVCKYKGLFFALSGVGTLNASKGLDYFIPPSIGFMQQMHADYINDKLSKNRSIWSVCSWHKNQQAMQVGDKDDATGWAVYETCRQNGAIIATGHHHGYERTKTLINMEDRRVEPLCSTRDILCVARGKTFAFVSGIGGKSVTSQVLCLGTPPNQYDYPYGCRGEWAKIYNREQNAKLGALFIVFGYQGDPYRAHGYFKNIAGEIVDEFDILNLFENN